MHGKSSLFILAAVGMMLCVSCAPKIYGTVRLVDQDLKPIKGESPEGTVINMINTTAKVELASTSAQVDAKGRFESAKESIKPGIYKVEAGRIGYATETQTVKIGSSTRKKLKFDLKKISEGQRSSISGASSDADKIVNPGEVNIQPPGM